MEIVDRSIADRFPEGVYRLTREVKNPGLDKRQRYDWTRSMTHFDADSLWVIKHRRTDINPANVAYTYAEIRPFDRRSGYDCAALHRNWQTENYCRDSAIFAVAAALAPHLEYVGRTPPKVDVYTALEALQALVTAERGTDAIVLNQKLLQAEALLAAAKQDGYLGEES